MTLKRIAGPAYIAATPANVYTPPNAAVHTVIRHIRVSNVDSAAPHTYTLYVGATGASAGGTEISGVEEEVAAKDHSDHYFSPGLRMADTDFLVADADAASKLTILVMGEYVAN